MAGSVHTKAYQSVLAMLVQARNDAGLSQAALARRLDKPASFVGKYELGERRLDIIELVVILKVLQVDAENWLGSLIQQAPDRLN